MSYFLCWAQIEHWYLVPSCCWMPHQTTLPNSLFYLEDTLVSGPAVSSSLSVLSLLFSIHLSLQHFFETPTQCCQWAAHEIIRRSNVTYNPMSFHGPPIKFRITLGTLVIVCISRIVHIEDLLKPYSSNRALVWQRCIRGCCSQTVIVLLWSQEVLVLWTFFNKQLKIH